MGGASDTRDVGCDAICDDLWVPKLVMERLIEAARIIQYTTGPVGPRGYGSGLPASFLAMMGGLDESAEDRAWWERASAEEPERPRMRITARKVTLAEEAIWWPARYLEQHDGPRRVLALYLRCKVLRVPFDAACKRKKWSRATAYRARDRAAGIIAQGLNRDRVPVR